MKLKLFNEILLNKRKLQEIFLYLLFGFLVTIINIIIFYLFTEILHIPYMLSNLFAWLIAVIVAFVTNKIWVFKSTLWIYPLWLKECCQFVLARLVTCIFDMGYMFVAISFFDCDKTISKIIANVFVIITNYILSKFWIFKKNIDSKNI